MNAHDSSQADRIAEALSDNGKSGPRKHGVLYRILRAISIGTAAGALILGFGFGYFANYVGALATPRDLGAADAIIVVTGGKSRLEAAVRLLKSGKGERLLISGVHPAADLNDLRAVTGGDRKMFNCCVDVDYAALDTIGNAEQSAKWLRDHDYGRVIVVTNNYHMPRTLLEMQRVDGRAEFVPYPVVNTPIGGTWLTDAEVLRVLFTEYTKYIAALARGVLPADRTGEPVEIVHVGPHNG